jgi:hypothetical protein
LHLNIKKKEIGIVVLPNSSYKKKEMAAVKAVGKISKAVCYVNVNTPFPSLLEELHKNKVPVEKFLFIDCITKKSADSHKNCIYLESPQALTSLSVTIKKALKTGKFKSLIFNSLSALPTYHQKDALIKFIHDLFAVIKHFETTAIFTMQKSSSSDLLDDVSMFADYIIEVR